jgi:hypothetical protein
MVLQGTMPLTITHIYGQLNYFTSTSIQSCNNQNFGRVITCIDWKWLFDYHDLWRFSNYQSAWLSVKMCGNVLTIRDHGDFIRQYSRILQESFWDDVRVITVHYSNVGMFCSQVCYQFVLLINDTNESRVVLYVRDEYEAQKQHVKSRW